MLEEYNQHNGSSARLSYQVLLTNKLNFEMSFKFQNVKNMINTKVFLVDYHGSFY